MNCSICGGEMKESIENGKTVYKCKFCGSVRSECEEKKVKTEARPRSEAAVAQEPSTVLSGEQIYEKMQNTTVEIIVRNEKEAAMASGMFVSNTGFVLTNAHAVLDENGELYSDIFVKFGEKLYKAVPVALGAPYNGVDNNIDVALLFVAGTVGVKSTEFGVSAQVKNGQRVYLIGNSLGEGTCITSGIVSDAKRKVKALSYPYIMTDAAANHGNSGGPLLNERGEVIGVLVAGIDTAKGMNYAIPIDMVKKFLVAVERDSGLNDNILGELAQLKDEPSNMAIDVGLAFAGVSLIMDMVNFIIGLFKKNKN